MVCMGVELPWKFINEVKEKGSRYDVFLILSVPIVLTLIFCLPQGLQNLLKLDYANPSVVNLFTSNFVHLDFNHYLNNITAYLITLIPLYLLITLGDEKRLFRRMFLVFLFVFPFIISSINLLVFNEGYGAGFSGIDSAFIGFLPVALFVFLGRKLSDRLTLTGSVSLLVLALTAVGFIYIGLSAITFLCTLLFLVTVGIAYHEVRGSDLKTSFLSFVRVKGYPELTFFSLLFFFIALIGLYPEQIKVNGTVKNILGHYSGFVLGFFVPYIYFSAKEKVRLQGSK